MGRKKDIYIKKLKLNFFFKKKKIEEEERRIKPKLIPGQKMKQRGLMVQKPYGMPSLSKAIYPQPLKASL
jgi:hypothetical protein